MLRLFDINRDGDISFDEFLRMVVTPPWCRLLPESVQGKLHEVIILHVGALTSRRWSWTLLLMPQSTSVSVT